MSETSAARIDPATVRVGDGLDPAAVTAFAAAIAAARALLYRGRIDGAEYITRSKAAAATLRAATADAPLVAWLLDEQHLVGDPGLIALRELPCSLADMYRVADDNGWCDDFDDVVDAAIEAGLLPTGIALPERSCHCKDCRCMDCVGE